MKRDAPKPIVASGPLSLGLSLTVERGPYRGVPARELKRRLTTMIALLQLENPEVSFVLTDDARIHELNKIYRHKDRPTDVLAFAMREGEFAELAGASLGDVIVSVPTARKQAEERAASALDEATMLCAHGLLHLLGWDHDTPARDRRMQAETHRLCVAAGPPGGRSVAKERVPDLDVTPVARRSKPGADRSLSRKPSSRKR